MEKAKILEQVRLYVTGEMAENDPAHDGGHVERVVRLTRELCDMYPEADSFRCELLAWLHDMSDDKLRSNRDSLSLREFLLSLGVPEEDTGFVIGALPYISYRKHPKLGPEVPFEIRIVQDADRIDAMGAIGIGRTFAFGGAKNRSLEESIRHFDEKLLKLYDLLNTEGAKVLARPRYEFLRGFYDQFNREFYSK